MLSTILIIVLILLLIGALPTWPYSAEWGYYPGGGVGLILVIVLRWDDSEPTLSHSIRGSLADELHPLVFRQHFDAELLGVGKF